MQSNTCAQQVACPPSCHNYAMVNPCSVRRDTNAFVPNICRNRTSPRETRRSRLFGPGWVLSATNSLLGATHDGRDMCERLGGRTDAHTMGRETEGVTYTNTNGRSPSGGEKRIHSRGSISRFGCGSAVRERGTASGDEHSAGQHPTTDGTDRWTCTPDRAADKQDKQQRPSSQ